MSVGAIKTFTRAPDHPDQVGAAGGMAEAVGDAEASIDLAYTYRADVSEVQTEADFLAGFCPTAASQAAPLFDYQRFAAEDEGRTEEPTEKRKREKRDEGRVPKTAELPGAMVLLGAFIVLYFFADLVMLALKGSMEHFLGGFTQIFLPNSPQELGRILSGYTGRVALALAPIFGTAVVLAVVGNVIQVGFMFTWKPLAMKSERIQFNFKKILFSTTTLVNLAKSLAKVFFIGWISYLVIGGDFVYVMKTTELGVAQSLSLLAWLAFKLVIIVAIILLVLSIPDYIYQRYEFIESIKMTRQEVKQEYKESEGDVHIKQRQRQRAREIAQQNMLTQVPDATVVITNPTHYAVAIRYNPAEDNGPVLTAKGVDAMAQRIKTIARDHNVEIRENAPLARALYSEVEIGEAVPRKFWELIISIIVTVRKVQNQIRARRAG